MNNIVKYSANDFVPTSFSHLMDRFFNDSLTRSGGSTFIPKVDVIENEQQYTIHFAAPGLKKDDFKIEMQDRVLTVSGERKFETEKTEGNYHSIETQFGSFSRSFQLPDNISEGKINAEYNNGILELTIPKDEKKAQKHMIQVK